MDRRHMLGALAAAAVTLALATPLPAEAQPSLRGRIQLDAARYDDDVTPLNDSIRVRGARVGVQGSHGETWSYLGEIDFAEDDVDVKDLWLRHDGLAGGRLQIGQFKVPFSLEQLVSSTNITFMERSQADMFAPSRRLGIGWSRVSERYTVAAMAFGQEIGTEREDGDDGLGLAARVTFLPLQTEGRFVHLGLSVTDYQPEHSNNAVMRFRQRPESRPAGTRLIDTGMITGVDSTLSYGLEAALVNGPISLQGEYMNARVRRGGLADPAFDAWYVYVSYFVTGEARRYSSGLINPPTPANSERGAWEVALRYSESDLDDGLVFGGTMDNITFAVNWYPRANVRFMFNYLNVSSRREGLGDDPSILQLRAQLTF